MMMMAYNNNKQLLRAHARIEYTSGLCKTVVVVDDVNGGEGWMASNLHEPRFA